MCHASCIVKHDSAAFDTSTMRSLIIGCKTKLGYRGGSELVLIISVQ